MGTQGKEVNQDKEYNTMVLSIFLYCEETWPGITRTGSESYM